MASANFSTVMLVATNIVLPHQIQPYKAVRESLN
jgi:hypothetical protein